MPWRLLHAGQDGVQPVDVTYCFPGLVTIQRNNGKLLCTNSHSCSGVFKLLRKAIGLPQRFFGRCVGTDSPPGATTERSVFTLKKSTTYPAGQYTTAIHDQIQAMH